jgi:catechol 2,3-dioxygenase-like lactoylglutathione lyase family enzyme
MLDHVTIAVTDLDRSKAFYDAALRCLGISRLYAEGDVAAGYGADGKAFFWISLKRVPPTGAHIAFSAVDHAAVDVFHAAALVAGGTDNGPPRLRPRYHPKYYGAFVLDPDGHNIEAVCHA